MFEVDVYWGKEMTFKELKTTYVSRAVETVLDIHKNQEAGDM